MGARSRAPPRARGGVVPQPQTRCCSACCSHHVNIRTPPPMTRAHSPRNDRGIAGLLLAPTQIDDNRALPRVNVIIIATKSKNRYSGSLGTGPRVPSNRGVSVHGSGVLRDSRILQTDLSSWTSEAPEIGGVATPLSRRLAPCAPRAFWLTTLSLFGYICPRGVIPTSPAAICCWVDYTISQQHCMLQDCDRVRLVKIFRQHGKCNDRLCFYARFQVATCLCH